MFQSSKFQAFVNWITAVDWSTYLQNWKETYGPFPSDPDVLPPAEQSSLSTGNQDSRILSQTLTTWFLCPNCLFGLYNKLLHQHVCHEHVVWRVGSEVNFIDLPFMLGHLRLSGSYLVVSCFFLLTSVVCCVIVSCLFQSDRVSFMNLYCYISFSNLAALICPLLLKTHLDFFICQTSQFKSFTLINNFNSLIASYSLFVGSLLHYEVGHKSAFTIY